MNDGNEAWNNEQAPFAAAETSEATVAAAAEAGASGGTTAAGTSAGAPPNVPPPNAAGAPPARSWGPVSGAYAAGAGYGAPPPPSPAGVVGSPSDPNPTAAFWLGLIPGVGAMYNGQVAKGFVHLIVFAVLVSIANAVDGIFGLFVAGWIFFMAFEAYHTAKARRDGLPLPNAFGWNDIGERLGLGKNWPFSPGAPVAAAPGTGAAAQGTPGYASAPNPAGWTSVPPAYPVPPVPPAGYGVGYGVAGVAPNWAGYVPPTAFGGVPPAAAAEPFGAAGLGAGGVPPGHGVPYAPVNAGGPYATPPVDLPVRQSRLPVGAIWLIGLGVLFLLGQWTPLLQFSRVWIPSIILAGLAVLLFARRMGWTGSAAWQQTGLPMGLRVATAVRMPGALLAIAILNGLHEAWIVRWHSSWPWLLITVGVLMLVERLALRQAASLNGPSIPSDPITPSNTTGSGGL